MKLENQDVISYYDIEAAIQSTLESLLQQKKEDIQFIFEGVNIEDYCQIFSKLFEHLQNIIDKIKLIVEEMSKSQSIFSLDEATNLFTHQQNYQSIPANQQFIIVNEDEYQKQKETLPKINQEQVPVLVADDEQTTNQTLELKHEINTNNELEFEENHNNNDNIFNHSQVKQILQIFGVFNQNLERIQSKQQIEDKKSGANNQGFKSKDDEISKLTKQIQEMELSLKSQKQESYSKIKEIDQQQKEQAMRNEILRENGQKYKNEANEELISLKIENERLQKEITLKEHLFKSSELSIQQIIDQHQKNLSLQLDVSLKGNEKTITDLKQQIVQFEGIVSSFKDEANLKVIEVTKLNQRLSEQEFTIKQMKAVSDEQLFKIQELKNELENDKAEYTTKLKEFEIEQENQKTEYSLKLEEFEKDKKDYKSKLLAQNKDQEEKWSNWGSEFRGDKKRIELDLKNKIEDLQQSNDEQKAQISKLENQISVLEKQIADTANTDQEIAKQKSIITQVSDQQQQIEQDQVQISHLMKIKQEYTNQLIEKDRNLFSMRIQCELLINKNIQLNEEYQIAIKSKDNKITQLRANLIQKCENKSDNHKTNKGKLVSSTELTTLSDCYKSEIKILQKKISEQTQNLKDKDARISQLLKEWESDKIECEQFEKEFKKGQEEIKQLKIKNVEEMQNLIADNECTKLIEEVRRTIQFFIIHNSPDENIPFQEQDLKSQLKKLKDELSYLFNKNSTFCFNYIENKESLREYILNDSDDIVCKQRIQKFICEECDAKPIQEITTNSQLCSQCFSDFIKSQY